MSVPESSADTPLVVFDRVVKTFGGATALAGVTLEILAGQFIVLLGPSGSGKTTLLRCAAGIERITAGTIRVDGAVVDDGRRQAPPERRDLAMVFQDYALWPHMTAQENVRYALKRRHLPSAESERRARTMLDRVGLEGLAGRYPSELSGGQQQRVALARALVARPRLLLFDEPLSNLDAGLRERLRIEIATLVREAGTTALYITHDQSEAFALADQIGILEQGHLVQCGTPETIYGHPATPFVAHLTGLAGELPGRVVAPDSAGPTRVVVGGAVIAARSPGVLAPGTPVRVLVRPSSVRLLLPQGEGGHLRGMVREVAFCGRGYEHVVAMPEGSHLAGVFAEERWERGQPVDVQLAPDGCLVFPEDAEAVPAPPRSAPG